MKRWLATLLLVLMLCGCAAQSGSEDPATAPPQSLTEPVETIPQGFYRPGSALEVSTNGAVRVFLPDCGDAYAVVPMGDALLLFSGGEFTTLTKLFGQNLCSQAAAVLDCTINPESASVNVSEKGLTYYDSLHRAYVFLDAGLKEVMRIPLPEEMIGEPVLSQNRKSLYYTTANAVRTIDLETNLDRLLKEIAFAHLNIRGLHCNDTVLECSVSSDGDSWQYLFLNTQTGQTLKEQTDDIHLQTLGDLFFATVYDGAYQENIIGSAHFGPSVLNVPVFNAPVEPVLNLNGALTVTKDVQRSVTMLDFYDIQTGAHPYALKLPGENRIWNIFGDPQSFSIWFLCCDSETDRNSICCWDLSKTPTQDTSVYLGSRCTLENPDRNGLQECADTASTLSLRHGVNVLIGEEAAAVQPWDYVVSPEYQVPLIHHCLDSLNQVLSWYPEGFLEEAASGTSSGKLNIGLVRSITGSTDYGSLDSAAGIQFWDDSGNSYLYITPDPGMEQALCHELFHVIDTYVLSNSSAYDNWNTLNPPWFEYDNDYLVNLYREDFGLTYGEEQAFIDTYSMSFPKEDRARIMEYAMMGGNAHCFEAQTMQAKLRQLCLGIREAFHLKHKTESFRWEQYLLEPIHANG